MALGAEAFGYALFSVCADLNYITPEYTLSTYFAELGVGLRSPGKRATLDKLHGIRENGSWSTAPFSEI